MAMMLLILLLGVAPSSAVAASASPPETVDAPAEQGVDAGGGGEEATEVSPEGDSQTAAGEAGDEAPPQVEKTPRIDEAPAPHAEPEAVAPEPEPPVWGPLQILGEAVAPGEQRELGLPSSESYIGAGLDIPVTVIRGSREGPSLCLTAGVHGDELNGIEIVREILNQIRPTALSGTLIGVPIVNLHGFQTSSRYLPDRRDLNRHFPGSPHGSSASRIAHRLFKEVLAHCEALVDLHTGSAHRTNLPQIRGDLEDPRVVDLARAFGATVTVHSRGAEGTLRRSAQQKGVPALLYEAGEPMRFQTQEIRRGVVGIRNLMIHLGMIRGSRVSLGEQRTYYRTRWVRADRGGILLSEVRLGDYVREGDILGTITDPIRKEQVVMVAPVGGRVIGMSLAPVMIPGNAAFHIGIPGTSPEPQDESWEGEHLD